MSVFPLHSVRVACLQLLCLLLCPVLALASALTWSVQPPTHGGFGTWSLTDANWLDEQDDTVAWVQGSDAVFAPAEGLASVRGLLEAGALYALSHETTIQLDHSEVSQLSVLSVSGSPHFWFRHNIAANANSYPALSSLLQSGLVFRPEGTTRFTGTLFPVQGGSPVLSVRGRDAVVEFAGTWIADTGSIISWLVPVEGGTVRITEDADMRFIKDEFYTLQLWVHGDGTGTLELDEGFVADRTGNGTVPLGIGSIRLSASTLITHHSRNLPLGYRPVSVGRTQANGHLVFEQSNGSRWFIRSNAQEYPGALWIYRDLEIITERDFTHTGRTETGAGYTALNGITLFGSSIVKSGPARLRFAGEQAYLPGSAIEVREGAVDFITDPSGGTAFSGGNPIGQLAVTVLEAAEASFHAPGRVGSLAVAGTVSVASHLQVLRPDGVFSLPEAHWQLTLGNAPEGAAAVLEIAGYAEIAGTLQVWRSAEFNPAPGTRIPLITAQSLSVDPSLVLQDFSLLGLTLEFEGDTVFVRTGELPRDLGGQVLLEDHFQDLGHWQDLSTVPAWGNPAHNRSAFTTVGDQVQLIRSGTDSTVGWTTFSNVNGLKTFTALDHAFTAPIDRDTGSIVVDTRMRWSAVSSSAGEGGRFVIAFTYGYPEGGLDLTPEGQPGSRLADFSEAWWARPAYHLRIRNSDSRAGSAFLQYGGGSVLGGEFERTSGANGYWLPGFISGAGSVAPGSGDDFPVNSWVSTLDGLASDEFLQYRYVLHPDRQEVWRDDNRNGIFEPWELKAVMPLPQSSTAPFYSYIERIEGLRLFWNGITDSSSADTGQVYVDWLRVVLNDTAQPQAVLHAPDIALIHNGVQGAVLLDAADSFLPNPGSVLYHWYVDGQLTLTSFAPQTVVQLPLGERTVAVRLTDAAGNQSFAGRSIIVSAGNLNPISRPGSSQTVTANQRLLAQVALDGSASSDPDGQIVRYLWTRGNGTIVLSDGMQSALSVVLPVGLHRITLTVFDDEGASHSADVSIQVLSPNIGPSQVIYRENFSRPNTSVEMGPWEVGWNLMSFNGEPVPSVQWDGNAHRSLSAGGTAATAPYLTKVNADPLGVEFDSTNARGHMWMNQMPFLNATPAEWLLWTEEYSIDPQQFEIDRIQFHATDSSPERVKVAFAVRIGGQWFVHWDARVETMGTWWRLYTLDFSTSGWYRFQPSPTFTIRSAVFTHLPNGIIEAFGIYMFKDYGWYVNQIDNFTVFARERQQPPPQLAWQLQNFPPEYLYAAELETSVWGPLADPDGDGNANLLEYALAGNPLQPASLVRIAHDEQGHPVLRFRRNPLAVDVSLRLQYSRDLLTWVNDTESVWQQLPADDEFEQWQVRPAQSLDGGLYWRLVVD